MLVKFGKHAVLQSQCIIQRNGFASYSDLSSPMNSVTHPTHFANTLFLPTARQAGGGVSKPAHCTGAGLILHRASFSAASELGAGWALGNKQYDALHQVKCCVEGAI